MKKLLLICLMFILTFFQNCFAHPPYEKIVDSFHTGDGVEALIIKSFVDGIFFNDPVRLEARRHNGELLFQTEYFHDMAYLKHKNNKLIIFQFDSFISILPSQIQMFDSLELKTVKSPFLLILAPFARIAEHFIAYFTLTLVLLFFGRLLYKILKNRWILIFSILFLLPFSYVVVFLSPISFVTFFLLVVIANYVFVSVSSCINTIAQKDYGNN